MLARYSQQRVVSSGGLKRHKARGICGAIEGWGPRGSNQLIEPGVSGSMTPFWGGNDPKRVLETPGTRIEPAIKEATGRALSLQWPLVVPMWASLF